MSRQVPAEGRWEPVAPASGLLSPLQDHALAYLPDDDALLVIGGRAAADTLSPWSRWHAVDLLELRAFTVRAAERLFGASAAYVADRPRVLVFGGRTSAGRAGADLRQIDLARGLGAYDVSTLKPAGDRPPGRYHHAAAFDPRRGWLVVYGGVTGEDQPISESGTWAYSTELDRWQLLEGAWVGERVGAVMVYDPRHATLLLAGGSTRGPREAVGDLYYLACDDDPTKVIPTRTPAATATATATTTATATLQPTPSPTASPVPSPTPTPGPPPGPTASRTPAPPPRCHLPVAQRSR